MVNVLHIIGSLNPGGAEILLTDVCRHVNGTIKSPYKFRVNVISNKRGNLLEGLMSYGTKVNIISRKGLDLRFILSLRKYILKENINIVHAHSGLQALHAILASLFLDVKIVLTLHGHSLYKQKFLKSFVFKYSDQVLFVSNTLREFYTRNKDKSDNPIFQVLYNGIDGRKIILQKKIQLINELNLHDGNIIMGMIGNFNSGRDHLTVCKALNEIIPTNPHVHFIFVGGAQNLEFEAICKHYCEVNNIIKNIHFLGSRTDVPKILNALDIFVYSSNSDTFGIAVVEAMMSGIPVIVNDLDVFKEITDNGAFAQLYRTKDVTDLAEKIEDYIKHPEKRKELGEKGQAWAMEKFTIERHVNQLTEIYNSVLAL